MTETRMKYKVIISVRLKTLSCCQRASSVSVICWCYAMMTLVLAILIVGAKKLFKTT